jgi:cell wall assembly regulator SMI1
MTDDLSIEAALERLSTWLSRDGQEVLQSLRPPATDADLDELRRAIEPYEIPPELVTMLRWHNGQPREPEPPPLLPLPEGPFLGTSDAAKSYKLLTEELEPWQWCRLWIPILQHRWSQTGVEVAPDGPGVVIEADFGNPHQAIVSSSLAALMHATADMAEAGLLLSGPSSGPEYEKWFRERQGLIAERADCAGWSNWPHDRILPNDEEASNWPDRWRKAGGFQTDNA